MEKNPYSANFQSAVALYAILSAYPLNEENRAAYEQAIDRGASEDFARQIPSFYQNAPFLLTRAIEGRADYEEGMEYIASLNRLSDLLVTYGPIFGNSESSLFYHFERPTADLSGAPLQEIHYVQFEGKTLIDLRTLEEIEALIRLIDTAPKTAMNYPASLNGNWLWFFSPSLPRHAADIRFGAPLPGNIDGTMIQSFLLRAKQLYCLSDDEMDEVIARERAIQDHANQKARNRQTRWHIFLYAVLGDFAVALFVFGLLFGMFALNQLMLGAWGLQNAGPATGYWFLMLLISGVLLIAECAFLTRRLDEDKLDGDEETRWSTLLMPIFLLLEFGAAFYLYPAQLGLSLIWLVYFIPLLLVGGISFASDKMRNTHGHVKLLLIGLYYAFFLTSLENVRVVNLGLFVATYVIEVIGFLILGIIGNTSLLS